MSAAANRIAAKVAETATKAAGRTAQSGSSSGGAQKGKQSVLQKGAKRDPELYILLTIMTGAFGLAGYHFGRKPTSSSSEAPVSMAEGTMPWQKSSAKGDDKNDHYKYQYHPGGDKNKAPKNAPSALNSVIVPNVTLPKSWHDQYNKYGKDEYDF
ncbi:MAG: hypothetical protein LQ348_000596 [Seirophora lacunosa]|nr:MAG: hypothetical protein LQ345_006023 [Seirophora villosa]KAI4207410.1 MAG: hypothetical protein LQ348_000596 [Seirophora lacunosa]